MKKTKLVLLFLALSLFFLISCKKDDTVTIRIINQTGNHMHNFVLDYGNGTINYKIFSKDYTFSAEAKVAGTHDIKVQYENGDGKLIETDIGEQLTPDMVGGTLIIYFHSDIERATVFNPPD